ncbi:MAG TPA: hypothetical protein VHW23_27815 [Kofleriaceae bacterium]|nr:hypothetical protein [Kofleriaceae bacterium]
MTLAASVLAGCPDRSIDKVDPLQAPVEAKDIPVNINRDLDLLFLIDDSPSMADKQANLAANFGDFITVLESIPGGLPNVHIGVVTSDMGTQGLLDMNPAFGPTVGAGLPGACSGVGKDGVMQIFGQPVAGSNFIVDTADPVTGVRTRNYTGDLATVFGNIAKGAGARGCGFEQHLAAVQRALNNPANSGFLRDNAYLGVIIIADEDDCSLSHYSLLADDNSARANLGAVQSFRCTRFGVLCDQGGGDTNQMNQVGVKGQCHPSDGSQYIAKIDDLVTNLKKVKQNDPNKIIVAGILGTTDRFAVELRTPPGENTAIPALAHSCSYVDGAGMTEVADPPIRIKRFLDQFTNRSTFVPICQKNLSGGLQQIGDLLKTVIGDPCIEGKLRNFGSDAAPVYDCAVSSVTNPGTTNAMETIMPECPATGGLPSTPCWHIVADPANCPMSTDPKTGTTIHPGSLKLKIENDDQLKTPGTDVHVKANCTTTTG